MSGDVLGEILSNLFQDVSEMQWLLRMWLPSLPLPRLPPLRSQPSSPIRGFPEELIQACGSPPVGDHVQLGVDFQQRVA